MTDLVTALWDRAAQPIVKRRTGLVSSGKSYMIYGKKVVVVSSGAVSDGFAGSSSPRMVSPMTKLVATIVAAAAARNSHRHAAACSVVSIDLGLRGLCLGGFETQLGEVSETQAWKISPHTQSIMAIPLARQVDSHTYFTKSPKRIVRLWRRVSLEAA